jgi:polysaccharide biosynthesis protein PslG
VHDYVLLALEVGEAIRAVAPQEAYLGPATSLVDFSFLAACFKAGLLNYWSGVSVHPYRQRDPESVAGEFQTLQHVIAAFFSSGKPVPVIAGEWGYSSTWNWKGMDDAKQGKLLPREYLSNLALGVPLTIWYDWHDDSTDPQDPESHFGLVHFPYAADSRPVYSPKPAYVALKTLTGVLNGYRFTQRLQVGGADDFVLQFRKRTEVRIAAWTTSSSPRTATIRDLQGQFSMTDHLGQNLKPVSAQNGKLEITLTDAPQYLTRETE